MKWLLLLVVLVLSACGAGSGISNPPAIDPDNAIAETLNQQLQAHAAQLPSAISGIEYRSSAWSSTPLGEWQALDLPSWAQFDAEQGVIWGRPLAEDVGNNIAFTLQAQHQGVRVSHTAYLTVRAGEQFDTAAEHGFYEHGFGGITRTYRNDLQGELAAEVLFLQSHTVRPRGNFERDAGDETRSVYAPSLVPLRSALLLFIPNYTQALHTVHVDVYWQGQFQQRLPLLHPNALPAADYQGDTTVAFAHNAWHVELPWSLLRDGMSLTFVKNANGAEQRGELPAADIEFSKASQLLMQSIRLGMLTHPDQTTGHYTLNDPILAASDYFQTIPVSKLIMGSYADAVLDRVIVRSGVIYHDSSVGEGGVYNGDMRENVAKSQVSVGINLANMGKTSHHMNQQYPHFFKQITNHHAWGMYSNGRQSHGLSGGNGIGTLYSSRGNEASHEWGHAYGLGHYPGAGLTNDGRFQRHHADSGWGYIAHRQRLRDNLTNGRSAEEQPRSFHFLGRIAHGWDAMSGGSPNSSLSVYTHHTAYSARFIQNDIAQFPIPDTQFASGYARWDNVFGEFREDTSRPLSERPAPRYVGVPVATILGGYDPSAEWQDGVDVAVIYPVFHGNYGNVFDLPTPSSNSADDACWVSVRNDNNEHMNVAVAAQRVAANSANQLHFNLPAAFRPTLAQLWCRRGGETRQLTETSFDGDIPDLPPVAIVGQEHGFQQLREREMALLSERFSEQTATSQPRLSAQEQVMLNSYSHDQRLAQLSQGALPVYTRYWQQEQALLGLSRQIQYGLQQGQTAGERKVQLQQQLTAWQKNGLNVALTANGQPIVGPRRFAGLNEQGLVLATSNEAEQSLWWKTTDGRIQLAAQPSLCLEPQSGRIAAVACDRQKTQQYWRWNDNGTLQNEQTNQCLDFAHHNSTLIMYGCHGGWNQQWSLSASTESLLLNRLSGDAIEQLLSLLTSSDH